MKTRWNVERPSKVSKRDWIQWAFIGWAYVLFLMSAYAPHDVKYDPWVVGSVMSLTWLACAWLGYRWLVEPKPVDPEVWAEGLAYDILTSYDAWVENEIKAVHRSADVTCERDPDDPDKVSVLWPVDLVNNMKVRRDGASPEDTSAECETMPVLVEWPEYATPYCNYCADIPAADLVGPCPWCGRRPSTEEPCE